MAGGGMILAYKAKKKPALRKGKTYKVYRPRMAYRRPNPFTRTLIPSTYPCKLRYVAHHRFVNPQTATPGVYVWSANGLHDPDISGTGHQPRGFDQFMPLFNHYVVVSSKITCHFMTPYEETTNSNSIFGISLLGGSVPFTSINDYMENRNTSYKVLAHTPETPGQKTVSKTFSAKKFLGRSHPLSDPQLKGSSSSNPSEKAFFHTYAGEASDSVDPDAVRIIVQIDYNIVFIEPKTPDQS